MSWRRAVIERACDHPLLWAGARAVYPWYARAAAFCSRRPRLRVLHIEVTNECNLRCTMCPNRLQSRERGLMPFEVLHAALAAVPDGSLERVSMISIGEPLLHPEIEAFVRAARGKAAEVFTSTNGQLVAGDAGLARRLLAAGVTHIHFSAEGYDAPTYESIRVGGSFEQFIHSLRHFRSERDATGSAARIDLAYTLVRPHSLDEIRRVRKVFGSLVDSIHFQPLNNQSHPEIAFRLHEESAGIRCYGDTPRACSSLWSTISVLWDGRVTLCPRDHWQRFLVGDVNTPIIELWNTCTARKLRHDHARGTFPETCLECSDVFRKPLAIFEHDRRLNQLAGKEAEN